MLRRLYHDQPEGFAFTPANQVWAMAQITKYPEGRQASAVIALLWRAQEQEGWLSRPAIEAVAEMLEMHYIRVLEVATFYFMFQLQPVGSVAHIQVCGTLSCMICGAEDLIGVCREKIAPKPFMLSADGKFSWEEVECLGACTNAPMAQIGKDYYEDLTGARLAEILDEFSAGKVPVPGPQNGRFSSEPLSGLSSLTGHESGRTRYNASVERALDLGDTVKRIDGSEVPVLTPWLGAEKSGKAAAKTVAKTSAKTVATSKAAATGGKKTAAKPKPEKSASKKPASGATEKTSGTDAQTKPAGLSAARESGADNLKMIKGVGPKLETSLNALGVYHFDQIAGWSGAEVRWVEENLKGVKGRVSRDGWLAQADILAKGGQTEFSNRVKKGDVY